MESTDLVRVKALVQVEIHKALLLFQKGGSYLPTLAAALGDYTGDLIANARIGVRKNSAGSTYKRRRINLIEGSNVTLTVADDSTDEEVDVTVAASIGGGGVDTDAIHDNVSGEISAITEKTTPHNDDLLLIEDSEASNVKKKLKLSNLPGGGDIATDTLWNAKGDLATGTGSDTAARLAVGTNGQILIADDSQSGGMRWAEMGASGALAMFTSGVLDLKTTATETLSVPSGHKLWLIATGIIVVAWSGVTVQPTISFGVTSSDQKYVANRQTTQLTAAGKREHYLPESLSDAETTPNFTVVTGATGTTMTGKVYWIGVLVKD